MAPAPPASAARVHDLTHSFVSVLYSTTLRIALRAAPASSAAGPSTCRMRECHYVRLLPPSARPRAPTDEPQCTGCSVQGESGAGHTHMCDTHTSDSVPRLARASRCNSRCTHRPPSRRRPAAHATDPPPAARVTTLDGAWLRVVCPTLAALAMPAVSPTRALWHTGHSARCAPAPTAGRAPLPRHTTIWSR